MATPELPRDFESWRRGVDSRLAFVEKRDPFINTAFSVPAAGTTQLDGNLDVAGLGRVSLANGGSVELDDKNGRQVFYVGGFTTNGFGAVLTRLNGQAALVFADNDPLNESVQRINLYDSNGAALFTEDANGSGAGWPLVPIQFEDLTWAGWANNTTATFTAVQQATYYKSSARIYFAGQAICDGTATGEVRLMCNGTQIGTTTTLANLAMTNVGFGTPATLPGAIGDPLTLTLETRVTGGSGKAYAKALTAMAWPS